MIIFFEYIDIWPKIRLVLYPSLENSTTHKNINTTFNYSISCQCATIWEKKSWGWGFLKTFAVKLSWGYFGTNPLATSTKYPQWKVVWIEISTFFLWRLCAMRMSKSVKLFASSLILIWLKHFSFSENKLNSL